LASGANASSFSSSVSRVPHPSASNAWIASRIVPRVVSGSVASVRNRPTAVSTSFCWHAT
jgi:hypothetical protein